MDNIHANNIRVRVRKIDAVDLHAEDLFLISSQQCLSNPHIGEALDRASDLRARQQAANRIMGKQQPHARALHFGHDLAHKCASVEGPDAGRCLIQDWVLADLERSQDEIDVAAVPK